MGDVSAGWRFDILKTLIIAVATGLSAYYAIDARVTVQEHDVAALAKKVEENKTSTDNSIQDLKADLGELRWDTKEVLRIVGSTPAPSPRLRQLGQFR